MTDKGRTRFHFARTEGGRFESEIRSNRWNRGGSASPQQIRRIGPGERATSQGIQVRSVTFFDVSVLSLFVICFGRSKLILFPVHAKAKARAGEATEEERKVASQVTGAVLPIRQPPIRTKARVPTEEEQNFNAYVTLRYVFFLTFHVCRASKMNFVGKRALTPDWWALEQRGPRTRPRIPMTSPRPAKRRRPRSKFVLIFFYLTIIIIDLPNFVRLIHPNLPDSQKVLFFHLYHLI